MSGRQFGGFISQHGMHCVFQEATRPLLAAPSLTWEGMRTADWLIRLQPRLPFPNQPYPMARQPRGRFYYLTGRWWISGWDRWSALSVIRTSKCVCVDTVTTRCSHDPPIHQTRERWPPKCRFPWKLALSKVHLVLVWFPRCRTESLVRSLANVGDWVPWQEVIGLVLGHTWMVLSFPLAFSLYGLAFRCMKFFFMFLRNDPPFRVLYNICACGFLQDSRSRWTEVTYFSISWCKP